jgi:hypothetical protein
MVRIFLAVFGLWFSTFLQASVDDKNIQSCMSHSPTVLIYQPWASDKDLSQQEWQLRLDKLLAAGYQSVLVQWTSYQVTSFLTADAKQYDKNGWLPRLIERANGHDISVIWGLHGDPEFFNAIAGEDQELNQHLLELKQQHLRNIKLIAPQWADSESFKGWYLPEEIDDLHWQTPQRQLLLLNYLQAMVKIIRAVTPNQPIYMSTFFSGAQTPDAYALWLKSLSEQTGVIWLIQDGLGTKRMSNLETMRYLQAVAKNVPQRNWKALVEIFQQTDTNKGVVFCPISPSEKKARRAFWCNATGQAPWAAFSLMQHMHKSRQAPYQDCPPIE